MAREATDKIANEKAMMEEAKRQREKKDLQAMEREEWHRLNKQKKWDKTKKAATAVRQPSPSKAQANAQQPLARAPIGQPTPAQPPAAQLLSGLAWSFQDKGIAANDLARRQQEWQVKQPEAAMRKMTKRENDSWSPAADR